LERLSSPEAKRIFSALSGIALILYGILLLLSLILPIYELKGPIEGKISLLHSSLSLYGSPISIDALSRASLLSVPLIAIASSSLILGVAVITASARRASPPVLHRAAFSLSLSFPSSSALAYLSKLVLVGEAMREIPLNLGGVTSAGTIIMPPVQVASGSSLALLTPLLSIFPPILAMALASVSAYLNAYAT